MRAGSPSLFTRVLLPILLLLAGLSAVVLVAVERIGRVVREDYHKFTVVSSGQQVVMVLELAASELVASRLAGNPVVTAAKQRTVAGEIARAWARSGVDGVIAETGGGIVLTTLDEVATRAVLAQRAAGYTTVRLKGRDLHCDSQPFAFWGWTVTTVGRHDDTAVVRREILLLPALFAGGSLLLAAGLSALLWVKLRRPLGTMVAALSEDREVPATGTAEFDRIGQAVNGALARVRERTNELSVELERRQRAETALFEREEHIRLLLNSTAEGIYGTDLAGICTFCNPSCLRLLGLAREEELLGKHIHELIHHTRADGTSYPEAECRIYEVHRTQVGIHVADEVFWRADKSSFPVEYWAHPVFEEGRVTGAVVAFVDISERAGLQQQLLQAQKMEAVGRLAGGIAHDFNNMLMAIVGYASLGRELAGEGTAQRKYHEQILEAAEKAANLTRQILAFSRRQVMQTAPADLNGVILGMGKMIGRLLGEDIEISLNLAGTPLVAMVDKGQIEQVLMNLCTNARDAMPGGGRLVIDTRLIDCDAETAKLHGLGGGGQHAVIVVSDTGGGMDARTRERIFEPFFTTKELGRGTGLGLSIVHGIVQQHHGQITVYSEPGRGTTFRIYLPLTAAAPAAGLAAPSAGVRGGCETVLLAEDNDDVRALAQSVLETAGYRVLAARDGEEAVRLFAEHEAEVALCLLDVVMPRRSGKEALEAIRARRPGARALYMSGHAADILGGARGVDPGVPVLAKPLLPRELLRHVREALDA